ncbi:MAG: hypothetical protein U5J62_00950 [Desulfurivibrio sp.]|nr:hypothetical protein [Desulfurivibrio sp.]
MDNYRALLAIVLSVAILLVYQLVFMPSPPPPPQAPETGSKTEAATRRH